MKSSVVFSLGGSIIVPDEIDTKFLKGFKKLLYKYLDDYRQFFIITGGGKTSRKYQQAAGKVNNLSAEDLDWLGIHSTHLNAHLIQTIFSEQADQQLITSKKDLTRRKAKIVVGGGFAPGNSTDYVATLCAQAYRAKTIVNLSNIDYVYDKDPKKFKDAKPLQKISWQDFRKLVGNKWVPGAHLPFDPRASKLAQKLGLEVIVMNGTDLPNLKRFLSGKKFAGTVIG